MRLLFGTLLAFLFSMPGCGKPDSPPVMPPHLQAYAQNPLVGLAAPEIEGEDIDGVRFKLSDYRGKVVVLDFWGDW